MKGLRNSNYFIPLCSVVLFLFSICPSAYATFQIGPDGVFIFPGDDGLQQFTRPNPVSPIGPFLGELFPQEEFDPIASGNYGIAVIDEFGNVDPMPFIFLDVENPTASDSISIHAWQYFRDAGFEMADIIYSVTDFTINIDIIIQDLHGKSDMFFAQAFMGRGGKAEVGMLAEGSYTVNANIYLLSWGGSDPVLYESNNTFFEVAPSVGESSTIAVPEPATVLLLGFGGLVLRRKR